MTASRYKIGELVNVFICLIRNGYWQLQPGLIVGINNESNTYQIYCFESSSVVSRYEGYSIRPF